MKASTSRFALNNSDSRPSQSQLNTSLKNRSLGEASKTSSSITTIPSNTNPTQVQNNGNHSINVDVQGSSGSPHCDLEVDDSIVVKREGALITDLLYKLHRRSTTLVDTHVICQDGFIPVHRCVLMACSKFLMELLIREDPAELASVCLPDYKICQVLPLINSLYTGCTVFKKSELNSVIEIITLLQVDVTYSFQPAREPDKKWAPKMRHYVEKKGSRNQHQQQGGITCLQNQRRLNQFNVGASPSHIDLSQVSPSSSTTSSTSFSPPMTLKVTNVRGGYTVGKDTNPSKSNCYSCIGGVEDDDDNERECDQEQEQGSAIEVDIEEIDDPSVSHMNGEDSQYEDIGVEVASEDEFEIVEIITDDQDEDLDGEDVTEIPTVSTTLSRRTTLVKQNSNQGSVDPFDDDRVFSPTIDLVNNVIVRPDIHDLTNRDDDFDEDDERDPLELESLVYDENFEEVPVTQSAFPGRSAVEFETITFDEDGQHKQIAQIITEPLPFGAWKTTSDPASQSTSKANSNFNPFKSPRSPKKTNSKSRGGGRGASNSCPPYQRQTRHHAAELKRLEQMRVDAEHNKSTRLVSSRRPRSIERSDQLKEEHRSRKEDLRFMDQLQQQIRLSLESQIASEDPQEVQSQPPIAAPAGPNVAEQNHVYDFTDDENDANSSNTTTRMVKSKDNEQNKLQMFEIEAEKEAVEKQRRVQIEQERLLKLHQIVEQRKIEQDIERQRKLEEKRQKQEAQRRKKLETDKQNKLDEEKRLQAEQERKQKLDEEKRLKLEAEKIKKLEEEKRLQAEQERKQKFAEEQRVKLEAEKLKKLEEEKRLQAEQEKRIQAEQEKRQKLKEEKRLKAEADKRQKLEKDSLRKLEEEKLRLAEEEKRRLAEEEKRIKLEEERRIKLEEQKRLKLEEEKRLKLEEEKRLKVEEEKRLKLEEERRLKREEEAHKKLEEEKRKKIENEKQLKAEKLRKQEEEKRLQIHKAEQRKKDEEARLLKIEEDKRLEAERVVREQEEAEQRQRDEEARIKLEAERLIQEEENRRKQEEQDKINAARKELERLEEAKRVEEELSLQIERDMQKARSDYESSANLENNSSSSSDATLFNQEQLKRPPKSTKFYEEFVEKKRRLLEAQRTQELLAILEGDRSKDKCSSSTDQPNPVEDGSGTSHTTVIAVPDQQSIINSKMCHVSATSTSLDVFASIAAEAPAMEATEEAEIAAGGNVTNIAVVPPVDVADDTPVEMKSPSTPVTAPEPESEQEIHPEVEQEVEPGHNMETTTIEYEEQTVEVDLSSSGASESFDSASVPYEIVEDIPVAENEVILSGDFDYSTEETVVENEVEVETECADIQEEVEVGGSIDSTASGNPADRADIGSDQSEIVENISSLTSPPSTSDPLESPANEKESEPIESVNPVPCQDDVSGAARKFLSVNSIQISVNEDPVEDGIEQEKERDDEEVDETETFSEAATTDDTASAASSGSKSLGRKIKKKRGKKVREKHTQTKPHHTTTTSPTARTTQLTVSLQKLPGDSKLIANQKQDSVIVHTDEVEKEQEKPEKIKITTRRRSSQIENKTGNASSTASRTPQSGVQLLSLSAAAHALSRHPKRIFTTRINGQNYDLSNPKVVISRVSKRVIKKYHRQSQKHSGHTHPALPLLTPAATETKGAKKWKRLSEEFRSASKGEKDQQCPQILKSSLVSEYYDGSRFSGPTISGSKKQFPEHQQSASVEPEDGSPPKLKPQVPSPPSLKQKRSSAPIAAVTPVAINNFPAVSKPAYITYNDLDWYQKELKRCAHCKNKYSVHTKATTCLMSHGFRRCLICLDLMSNLDASYEQHYIKFHSVRHQKGSVACPICGKILMIRGLQLHVTKKHMQQKVDVGHKLPFEIPKFQIQPQQQPSQPPFYGSAIETPFYQNQSGQLPFSAPVEPYSSYPQHPTFNPQSVDQILHPKQQSVVLPSIPSLVLKKMQGSGNEVQLTSSEDDDGGETESQTTEDEDDVHTSRNNNYKTSVRASNNSPNAVSILKEKSVNESPKDDRNGSNLSPGMYAFKEHRGTQGEATQQYSAPIIDEDMARKAFLPISITPLPFDMGISNPQNDDGNSNNSNSSQKSVHNQQNQQQQQQNLQSQQQQSAVEPQYVDQTITLQTQEITVSQLHIERTPIITTESQQQHHQHHENQQQQQHHSQQQHQQQHSQNQHSSSHYNHHSHASQQQQQAQLSLKRQSFYPFPDIVQPKKRLIHHYNEPPSNYEYGRKHVQPYGEHSNHIPPYYSMPPPAHSLPAHYSQSTEHHSSFMHRTSSHHLHPHAFPPPPSTHSQHHSHHGSQLLPSHGHGHHSHHGHSHHSHNQHHGGHGHSSSNDFPIIHPNITVDASGSVMCELSPVNYAASPIQVHQYNSNGPKALQALSQDMYGKGNSNQNSNSINSSRPQKSLFATPPPPLSGISIANLVEESSGNGSGGSNSGGGLFEAIIMEEETSRRQQLHQQLVWEAEQQGDSQGQQGGSGRGGNGGGNDGGRGGGGSSGGGMQRNESVINLNMDYLNQNLESMEDSFHCDRCNEYFNCSKLLAEHVCRY